MPPGRQPSGWEHPGDAGGAVPRRRSEYARRPVPRDPHPWTTLHSLCCGVCAGAAHAGRSLPLYPAFRAGGRDEGTRALALGSVGLGARASAHGKAGPGPRRKSRRALGGCCRRGSGGARRPSGVSTAGLRPGRVPAHHPPRAWGPRDSVPSFWGPSLMVPLPPCPRPQKTLWSPWAALSPAAPLPGHRPCLVSLLWAPKQDDRRESSPALERRRGRARPSGGSEKAPPVASRPGWPCAPLGLWPHPPTLSPCLLLASCASVLPRGPGSCPLSPWLLPGGDFLLCCLPGGPAALVGGLASRFLGLRGSRGWGWVPRCPVSGTAGPREGVLSNC